MIDTSQPRLEWHILTLEATPERARSIWQNEQLAFYRELLSLRSENHYDPKCSCDSCQMARAGV